jgi:hypothetical protein
LTKSVQSEYSRDRSSSTKEEQVSNAAAISARPSSPMLLPRSNNKAKEVPGKPQPHSSACERAEIVRAAVALQTPRSGGQNG